MLNRLSIRWRMTLLSVLLLLICCMGLTVVLNYSANRMAATIEATPLIPGMAASETEFPEDSYSQITSATTATTATAARRSFLNESILWMCAIVFAGGALTYFVAGRALRPLGALSTQMKNRTVHNLSEALPVPQSGDEVAALTVSFNDMSAKLDDVFSMQRRFAQSAAHELRTPLTLMKTKLQVFHKKPGRTPAEYEALFEGVEAQTDRLSSLVLELLDLTCLDAAEYTAKIPLPDLLAGIVDELSTIAKDQKVTVSLDCPEIEVKGSQELLHRAFYNLIENALKYNRAGGQVAITTTQSETAAVVAISDTGIGIPPEQRELIFEPFYRVDKSRSRQMGGAGLGLSTVQRIVQQHGGSIVATGGQGGGSVFTVTLPNK